MVDSSTSHSELLTISTWLQCTPLLTFSASQQHQHFQAALVSLLQPIAGLCLATDLSNDCPCRSTTTKIYQQRPSTRPLGSGSQCCVSSPLLFVCQRHTVWPGHKICWYTSAPFIMAPCVSQRVCQWNNNDVIKKTNLVHFKHWLIRNTVFD